MKKRFAQKVNTRLFLLPALSVLLISVVCGVALYFFSPLHLFNDFYKLHLVNLSSEKKFAVDAWFANCKRQVEYLSKNQTVRDNMVIFGSAPVGSDKLDKRMMRLINSEVQLKISKVLEDTASASGFRMIVVLSKNGRIISSSQKELVGEDWSDRAIIKDVLSETKPSTVAGFYNEDNKDKGIFFISSILDASDNVSALVYAVSDTDKLSRLLHIENGFYKTERIELMDRDGNLVLSKNGIPDKKLKYNIPKDNKENIVRLRDEVYFYVLNLDNAPFRLIGIVERPEVVKPVTMITALFLIFALLLITAVIIQAAYLFPRLVKKPLSKLLLAVRSAASGNLNPDWGKDYQGEVLQLKTALESMIDELKAKESALRQTVKSGVGELKPAFYESLSHEIKAPLSAVVSDMESILENTGGISSVDREKLAGARNTVKVLISLIDDLIDLSILDEGKLSVIPEEFNLCDLLAEIESYASSLIGSKQIELIIDCNESFINKPVLADRHRFKQILRHLVSDAVSNTKVGTITVLLSEAVREGLAYMEVSVADTGYGVPYEILEGIFADPASLREYVSIAIAKGLTEALGGNIAVDSKADKGTVFTISIPMKAVMY